MEEAGTMVWAIQTTLRTGSISSTNVSSKLNQQKYITEVIVVSTTASIEKRNVILYKTLAL